VKKEFIICASHPIIKNHQAYGQALLPGLAYIDLLYQFFREHGHNLEALELRNLSIYRPLIVDKGASIKLSLQADEVSKGLWSIQLQDWQQRDRQVATESLLYIKAEMHHCSEAPVFEDYLDFQALQTTSKTQISLHDIYAQCSSQGLIHSGIMKAEGTVYTLDDAQIVEVSLPAAVASSATNFMFHPTLLDGSSVGSSNLFATLVEGEQRLFLPLFYESFRACSLFDTKCIIRVKTASVRRKKDMIYIDLEFFNDSGKKVAELKNFVNKLVRESASINPSLRKLQNIQAPKPNDEKSNKPQARPSQMDKSETFESMEEVLKQIIASYLECAPDQIDTNAGYYELGMNSAMLLQVVTGLEAKFAVKLIPTLLFEYTNIEELAAYLIDENFTNKSFTNEQSANLVQANVVKTQSKNEGDIAIIGIAGRYPRAKNINEFWQNLLAGKDCISEIPKERWDWRSLAELKSPSGKSVSKWGGFIQDPECFDHQFFRISPREAEVLDPQERLFLQTCWESIEDAGYTPETLVSGQQDKHRKQIVGVFVGVMHKDYVFLGAEAIDRGEEFLLSLNYASIANRVSYFCDFQGPSMVIDTVCSSSLTALHLALESIRHGESDIALAGGVNLSLHPNKYMTYGLLDMYSSDGRCRTFGSGGDGYVSGEGVGAVVLKPLALAIQDRDHIYALIKGSTINHVGKVSGISVPNPGAQGDMILQCLKKTGINPRTIRYVEAHGTGTSLGDPIELQGLSKAFKTYTNDTQFCAIGSVKSNIGHTESAAGISGLSKVALQLYYKTLVPSLHSQEINPHLDLQASPFYLQHETQHWEGTSGQPRRASLSSFGATGSNAHVILEEYIAEPSETISVQPAEAIEKSIPVLIPLSAKNEERLKEAAQNLYHYLVSMPQGFGEQKTAPLRDIAYTLQVGRKAMETRLIFLVDHKQQLIENLKAFLDGDTTKENSWYSKQVKEQKHSHPGKNSEVVLQQWMLEGRLDKIGQAWIQGIPLNWDYLYELEKSLAKPARVSLPTYPFAKVRHWVPMKVKTAPLFAALHPLLHRNTSTLGEQRFSSKFSGEEFFLADHRVQSQKILPGVAYLEMARAAVALATSAGDFSTIGFKNIIWQQPLVIDGTEKTVHIGLFAKQNSQVSFEIYTGNEHDSGDCFPDRQNRNIHCQGIAIFKIVDSESYLDLEDLQEKTDQNHFTPEQCYQAFMAMGIDYGEGHQGIAAVHVGTDQILAELSLPACVLGNHQQFILHPSLLDSALQAAIGFALGTQTSDAEQQTSLPYALETLEIKAKCTTAMWVWIRYADNNKAGSPIQKFDLDLCDDSGKICVLMRGFSARVFSSQEATLPSLLHPLLHQQVRTDDSAGDRFISRFTGEEFFLRDHQQVMLGAAYLEMARCAGQFSTGQKILGLKNIVWSQLLFIAGQDRDVFVQLHREGDRHRFSITTEDAAALENIHFQGQLVIDQASYPATPARLNIQDILARCSASVETADCAQLLQSTHGISLLTIKKLWHNEKEALALLQLPDFMRSGREDYTLHPSMMNGAILSSVVFSLLNGPREHMPIPFVLDKLWIYQEMPERAYAYVTLSSANKHDIELVDEKGESIVSFKGFTASIQGGLQGRGNSEKNTEKSVAQSNTIYATTQWQESALSADKHLPQTTAAAPIFIITQENPELNNVLSQRWPTATIETLASVDADIAETVQANYLQVFQRIKTSIAEKPKLIQPIVILVPENETAYLHAGFAAMLKTARFENAKIAGKLIRYAVDDKTEGFAELVVAEMELAAEDVEVYYTQTGTRKIKKLNEISDFGNRHEKPVFNADLLHEGDVVWITGGLGGLGQIFVKHLSQTKGLKLILSGRSTLNAAREKVLHELQQADAEISYLSCEISDKKAVAALVQSIHKKYGKLNGIIHSAGLNQDAYILNKTSEKFITVLSPKIAGILAIEESCRDIPLNFIVLFSSIAGVFGSIGQVDYATANAFLDSFAEARNLRVQEGKCFGKTISINWPLWRDGGMGVEAQNETLMQKNTGMRALTTDAGLNAFELALSSEFNQILVAQGETEKIRSRLLSSWSESENQHQIQADETEPLVKKNQEEQSKDEQNQRGALTQVLHKDLAAFICRLQKVNPEEIDIESEFSNYGFDSISFTSFTNYLNEMYGLELMPTLFFEYSNVRSLANSLLENHQEALLKKYKLSKKAALPSQGQSQVPAEQISKSQPFIPSPVAPVHSKSTQENRIPEHQTKSDAIAIIGMSGKFPGAENLRDFWQNLEANRDLISEIPQHRWNWRDYYSNHQNASGKTKIKWGGFITDIDRFDPLFFGISPIEAELMDPQFRLFLETVWATIEDAGYRSSALSGSKTAVYVGVTTTDYKDLMQHARIKENSQEYYGMFPFMLANRVSYLLNFRGPSEAIDTACSSSLVAIHRAIESIRQGSCEMAVAGGVNIIANPQLMMAAAQGGMLSEDGRCKTFDKSANGYVRGEGVGAILLKPLAKAIEDNDSIYGVIRGSAENHGGRATSPTAPNPVAQQELLISAYTQAGVAPETVGYIEAHGTGTPLGDPIEFNGIKSAFAHLYQQNGRSPADKPHCAIGSVKTNIGHLEAAAGISGVLKVLLMMKHRIIPGNSHLQEPNPYLQLTASPFYLAKHTQAWAVLHDEAQNPIPRRAGVSSFGIGGSNVHLVLEEYVAKPVAELDSSDASLIILSAKNQQRLVEIAKNLHDFLIASRKSSQGDLRLGDIAYTLQIGREEMEYRLGFLASSIEELEEKLAIFTSTQGENQDLYQGSTKKNKDTLEAFESDDDLQEILAKWIEHRKFAKILKLWVKGLSVNWRQLYPGTLPRRISLPSYPFARESYWIPASVQPLPVPDTSSPSLAPADKAVGVLMCQPIWKEKAATGKSNSVTLASLDYSQHLILFCEMDAPAVLQDRLSKGSVCHALQAQGEDLALSYQSLCEQVFTHLKEILENKPKGKVFVQVVIPGPGKDDAKATSRLFQGLSALLKTAHLENPKIIGQLIEIDSHDTYDQLIKRVQENSQLPEDVQVRYRYGQREVMSWEEVPFSREKVAHIPWKEGGVYLITGGAGGLGLIFAREIARRVKSPTIILSGRSHLSQEKQYQLQQEAQLLGARLEYRHTDVSQQKQVDDLIQGILRDFAKLDGILHAAGVIHDSFIIKKTAVQFQQVLAPKVCGTVYLDRASKEINLDFLILFSSGVAALGNAGQADYAVANAFMDAYADYRHALFVSNKRFGRSLSINWPLWQEGGMHVDEQTLTALEQNSGIKALQTDSGVEALFCALSLKSNQVMVVEGNLTTIRQGLFAASTEIHRDESSSSSFVVDEKRLLAKTLHQCKSLLGSIIKLSADRIETEEPLERYGIDSLIISQMNHHLEAIFGEISKTLLYEYQTLGELASYLTTEYRHECMTWTGLAVDSTTGKSTTSEPKIASESKIAPEPKSLSGFSLNVQTPLQYEPIAIIGLAGRYAQANTPQAYWKNLQSGKDCVTEIPPERWSLEGFYHENLEEAIAQGKSYSKWGSFINGFADFDPLFFSISPREAIGIDPQERLFLQSAWEAIEDAGYTREILRDQFRQRVGVFVGITKTGFSLYGPELWQRGEIIYPHTSFSSVANRISYILNLRGPSLPIDTMCSSSLTAIHEACEHIRRGECELAIAGGVNLYLHPSSYVQMCAAHMLSQDGKCKSFGEGGNGFVPGEGLGAVLLKPLTQAISDRDHIYAVIRGSSVNHGGKTNGYTIPNPNAQAELIEETLDKAGVDARTLSYIEAHGTGTELGDPIEISGLTKAFQKHTTATNFCALGSVKSNLGHLEAAAGIAGLTKIILQLKHGQIAPSLHATELNSNINFAKTPFVLQQTLSSWKRPLIDIDGETKEYPRRAGISSFGAGGSNAHLIVEEYVEETRECDRNDALSDEAQIIILSAKSEDSLYCAAKNLHDYLNSKPAGNLRLRDIAYTLQVGREAMEERLGLIVRSLDDLKQKLNGFVAREFNIEDMYRGQVKGHKKLLALFTSDDELQEAIEKWIQRGKFAKLVELWSQGLAVDWSKIYREPKPYRVSLPTYPFEQQKYWIEEVLNAKPESSPLSGEQSPVAIQERKSIGTWMGFPVWKEKALSENERSEYASTEYAQRIVMLFEMEWFSDRALESQIGGATCIHLRTKAKTLAKRFQEISIQVFERIKAVQKNKGATFIQLLIPSSGEAQLFSALTGLLRTAHLENPAILGQLIALESGETQESLIDKIQRNSHCPEDTFIRYQQERRQTISWQEVSVQTIQIPWQEGGVYLITGGLGGLGFIFAKHIAQQTTEVSLILTGRSALDERRREQIKKLESLGARVYYRQIDISQKQETERLIENIENDIGSLKGILHSAGTIRDNFIIKKTASEFQWVLTPKVDGVIHLDQATKELNLDFFVLFSSLAGSIGNVGQVDYACANAFMDAYAYYRNGLVATKKRAGQTLSINWPLWKEGGMQIDPSSEKAMLQNSGLVAMETKCGIQALIQGLSSEQSQIMVLRGDLERLQISQQARPSSLLSQIYIEQEDINENKFDESNFDENDFEARSLHYFKNLISSILEIPAHRIQNDELLETYGINSIVIMQLTKQLENVFGSLSKTLFFEYPTIDEINQYFVASYKEKLKVILGLGKAEAPENHRLAFVDEASPKTNLRDRFLVHTPSLLPLRVAQTQDIAIIGVSGRYPLSPDLETFWENLSKGKNCITEIPKSRWDGNLYFDLEPSNSGKAHSKWGGFLTDVDKFDALFFNISPREAQLMNPNERLFLETVWDLIERSGYTPERIQEQHENKVGVYIGATHQQYQALASDPVTASILSMSSYSAIANRVSYFFNFHGPSIAIDTMCSSSLIAIQLACDSLLKNECQMAIAGGVNLSIHPNKYIGLSLGKIIGRQNTSKSFGEGDGYLPAEGVGAVLLKPIANAIKDGDSILAVIKSISTNHGGHTHGFYVPNPNAQAQLFEDNFRKSGIDPRTITYVESAANGSPLGDPIEVSALNKAFQKFTQDQGFCAIGSVKSNIGHAEAASGISQLTKVILQLKHQELVPSINAESLNPNLSFDGSPFYLQQKLQPWQRPVLNIDGQEREFPRRATVSSFGAGGSNAHLIIEEYIPSASKNPVSSDIKFPGDRELIVFSAKSRDRLQAVLQQMSHFVQSNAQLSLKNMAYTLQVGRMAMTHRIAILVNNQKELIQGINEVLNSLEQNAVINTSIPVYMGDVEANHSEMKHLLSGKSGEAMMKVLLMENDMEKIALYWVKGGNIPWQLLHKKGQASMIFVPTYPFAKRRCWIEAKAEVNVPFQIQLEAQTEPLSKNVDYQSSAGKNIEGALVDIMLLILGLTAEEFNLNTPVTQYGVDSIMFARIFQQIKSNVNACVNLTKLLECKTTQDMLLYLKSERDMSQTETEPANQQIVGSSSSNDILFPELIQLNSSTKGRPVFWFHGIAGVMVYAPVAEKSQRPFYGIQPWSWIDETASPSYIQAMVKRYLDAIRSVQPEGPYDFGGYSLGGVLAYEATRQLQEQGEQVKTIVMVDTIQNNPGAKHKYSLKTDYLVTLNRVLALFAWQGSEKTVQEMLIRSDELEASLSDDEYLTQLIALAKKRGLLKAEKEIRAEIEYAKTLDEFYQREPFTVMPLPDPHSVNCYYFRNKNGSLLGDQAPYYFAIPQDKENFATAQAAVSRQWENHLPNLQIIDINSSSHMTMFSEEKSSQIIIELCETLYSENALSNTY
jgi:acyl transferase domain-containing protein/thioesterase domain-containing protein/acyl carrier protein